jgi:hypothetical protein
VHTRDVRHGIALLIAVWSAAGCAVIGDGGAQPRPGVSPVSPLGFTLRPSSSLPVASPRPTPTLARRAPDFSLQRENGQTMRLSDARGTPVVLVFYRGQT